MQKRVEAPSTSSNQLRGSTHIHYRSDPTSEADELLDLMENSSLFDFKTVRDAARDERRLSDAFSAQPKPEANSTPSISQSTLDAVSDQVIDCSIEADDQSSNSRPEQRETSGELQGLRVALQRLWTGGDDSCLAHLTLSADEACALGAIVGRKMRVDSSEENSWRRLSTRNVTRQRRREENVKYVSKRLIRAMIDEHYKHGRGFIRSGRSACHYKFFSHFFGALARDRGEPVERFMLPQTVAHSANLKSFSRGYLELVKLSPEFVVRFTRRVEIFAATCEAHVRRGVDRMVDVLARRIAAGENLARVCALLGKRGKSKLPWTVPEIKEACQQTLAIVNKS